MERHLARRALIVGLLLGLLAELALDGRAAGLNVPLVVVAMLVAGAIFRRPGRTVDPLDAWLPITSLVLAGFVAIRGDEFLAALDTLGAVAFGGASLIALAGTPVTRRSARAISALAVWLALTATTGVRHVLPSIREPREQATMRRWPWLAPLARGLAVGLPLAMIFALLFASADPIFSRGLDDVMGLRIDLGTLPGRVLFVLGSAWLAIGVLAGVIDGVPADPPVEVPTPSVPQTAWSLGASAVPIKLVGSGLGALEATVILLVVDAVVASFVALQVAYLFGGLDTLAAAGLTYSDYARRGFFELVAAAVLAGTVVAALEAVVGKRSRAHLGASLGLLALTGVVLVSAAFRLSLYQQAYGWTELRFYVFTAIAYVAAALLVLAGLVMVRRTRWLVHGLAVLGVVGLVGLNLAAPAAFVAERNLERVLQPGLVSPGGRTGLDAPYLAMLPDDAVPPLVAALDRLPAVERAAVQDILERRLDAFRYDPALDSPMAWNLGREQAKAALTRLP